MYCVCFIYYQDDTEVAAPDVALIGSYHLYGVVESIGYAAHFPTHPPTRSSLLFPVWSVRIALSFLCSDGLP